MDKFNNELKKADNPWIKRIGKYLLSREDIKDNLKKENKSLQECFDYILIELSKKSKRQGQTGYYAGDDEELYGLAVHYYDEDNIKVPDKTFKTNADGSAGVSELIEGNKAKNKTSKQEGIKTETSKKESKPKKIKAKKESNQISLFDILGDENV